MESLTLWAISDGRAGNVAQAMGLAEAIARRRPATVRDVRVELRRGLALLPPRIWQALGPGLALAGYRNPPAPPWPDLAIGAGRRVAPLLAALRRAEGVKAVQLLDPRMPARAFDLVVAPEHDRLAAVNAVSTVGSIGRLTPGRITAQAARWRHRLAHLPRPRVAVLLGGPSRSATWREADSRALEAALQALAAEGAGLMVTPSRRTPTGLADRLRKIGGGTGAGIWVWRGNGDNPYPGILGLADVVLVTEDSVNMASEAASTGKPVHVFGLTRVAPKIRRFHEGLVAHGAARRFAGGIGRWSYVPLAEADRIAAEVDVRLLTP